MMEAREAFCMDRFLPFQRVKHSVPRFSPGHKPPGGIKMNNAAKDSTFIYLSNIEDIPFDRAVMASGLSSNMDDYFSPEEAVFVGWKE